MDLLKLITTAGLVMAMSSPLTLTPDDFAATSYISVIPEDVKSNMLGKTIKEDSVVLLDDLRYLKIAYWGYDDEEHVGELIVNKLVADEVLEIFAELYDARYPIEKMCLPDEYGGNDEESMQDNNTSAFNDRPISKKSLSYHQFGLAIDVNPLYNPYYNAKSKLVQPKAGKPYLDRTAEVAQYIRKDDICYNAFLSRGWSWGGDWTNPKDYQHFEKTTVIDIKALAR
ncbi:hypothetical protein AGMMS49975_20930 [Clostridia bacterium]|nr:hypothetical protein AGMMS49975_20930 [Clostridia bacterium]